MLGWPRLLATGAAQPQEVTAKARIGQQTLAVRRRSPGLAVTPTAGLPRVWMPETATRWETFGRSRGGVRDPRRTV
jgi:hypothetical protein